MSATYYDKGKKAIVINLQRKTDLNGTHVTIERELPNGRIAVVVPRPMHDDPRTVQIRPENLKLREECPLCMDAEMDYWMEESGVGRSNTYWCCGQRVCNSCHDKNKAVSAEETGTASCPMCRREGSSFNTDLKIQLGWMRERANRGDVWAMCNLAYQLDVGNGVPKDQVVAREWYRRSAEGGYAQAAHNLACSHRDGEGGPVDLKESFKWYLLAAELGYARSMTNVGYMYLVGKGGVVVADLDKAMHWYKKATTAGHLPGQGGYESLQMLKEGLISYDYACNINGPKRDIRPEVRDALMPLLLPRMVKYRA